MWRREIFDVRNVADGHRVWEKHDNQTRREFIFFSPMISDVNVCCLRLFWAYLGVWYFLFFRIYARSFTASVCVNRHRLRCARCVHVRTSQVVRLNYTILVYARRRKKEKERDSNSLLTPRLKLCVVKRYYDEYAHIRTFGNNIPPEKNHHNDRHQIKS